MNIVAIYLLSFYYNTFSELIKFLNLHNRESTSCSALTSKETITFKPRSKRGLQHQILVYPSFWQQVSFTIRR